MTWLTVMEYLCYKYVPLVVNTSWSFPHSWLVARFVTILTRWVPLVEQELSILLEHLSSPPVFSGACVTRSLVLCVCFVCPFVIFLLAIVLSVLLRYTDSDYPFGIFKLFFICLISWHLLLNWHRCNLCTRSYDEKDYFNFNIMNFPRPDSYIATTFAHGFYISSSYAIPTLVGCS